MITRRTALSMIPALPMVATAAPSTPSGTVPDARHKIRGMTISCPTDGVEWGRDEMLPTLDQLARDGCNWVAIHPYAGIERDGTVSEWRRLRFDAPPAWITRPIREAHARGLKVLIKPHIGYWGSGFDWRGAITFEGEAAWRRFATTYQRWIVKVAQASAGADAFAVGTELDKTLHREGDWRRVIAAIRAVYTGPLTYAANWTDYQRVTFWDALDAIGVQAYFPLVNQGTTPTAERLAAGWARQMQTISAYAERHRRYVVFTELGYNDWSETAAQPWAYDRGGPDAEAIQARALASALHAVGRDPRVMGAFLWKCYPGGRRTRDFDMQAPHTRAVIRRYWG